MVPNIRGQDLLLVDGELYSGQKTLAGYDNPVNRRFAWAPLHAVGIRDQDGELKFQTAEDPHVPGLYGVTKHFEANRDAEAMMGGESLQLTVVKEGLTCVVNETEKTSHAPPW